MTAPGFTHSIRYQASSGATGPEGDSAYEVAVTNGFVGTQKEWLASLVGPAGPSGTNKLSPIIYFQNTPLKVWQISHPFTYRPIVTVFDNNDDEVQADIKHDPGIVIVEFGFETTGVVELF